MRFEGQVGIFTGAASGLGLLTAQQFAEEGGSAVLTDVNLEAVTAAATALREKGLEALALQVDVRHFVQVQEAVAATLARHGRIDVLHNCAGGSSTRIFERTEPFHELPIEVLDWGLDVNLRGPLYFCRAVLGPMIQQGSGVIINIGSVTGVEGSAGAVDYSAAKGGIIGLTKSIALCGAPHGVRACCVSPGPVLTRPGMANMRTRLGRAADPMEIVNFILYLCSDQAAFITGSNHLLDGGRSCGGMD